MHHSAERAWDHVRNARILRQCIAWYRAAFLLRSPRIDKVDVLRSAKVRRAQLYYLRGRRGKAARLKEKRAVA